MAYTKNATNDEEYTNNQYNVDASGKQIYAKLNNNNEYYLRDPTDTFDIYALDENQVEYYAREHVDSDPIFATDEHQNQKYAKDKNQDEFYPKRIKNDAQVYATMNVDKVPFYAKKHGATEEEIYAVNEDGNEIYIQHPITDAQTAAIKSTPDTYYYAQDKDRNEYYPLDGQGNEYYIVDPVTKKQVPATKISGETFYARTDLSSEEFYPIDENGDQYYLLKDNFEIYAKTATGNFIYARKQADNMPFYAKKPGATKEEIYAMNEDGKEIYIEHPTTNKQIAAIKNSPDTYYYAKDEDKNEYYPKDEQGNEYYLTVAKKQVLATKQSGEAFYAKNNQSCDEFYPTDENGDEYYLLKNKIEIYAKKIIEGTFYAKSKTKKEVYAKDFVTKREYYRKDILQQAEVYAKAGDKEYYTTTLDGKMQFYANDAEGIPFYAKDVQTGVEYYAEDGNDDQYYAFDNRTREFIYAVERLNYNKQIYLTDKEGNQKYAKKEKSILHEKYALNERHVDYYAINKDGDVIFATDKNGNEIYASNTHDLTTYAKDVHKNEYYPTNNNRKQQFIMGRYAKTANGDEYYPTDEDGNEFYSTNLAFAKLKDKQTEYYATTFDNHIIVPLDLNNKPKLIANETKINLDTDIPFHRDRDAITNVPFQRVFTFLPIKRVITGKEKSSSSLRLSITILQSIIIFILVLLLTFSKKK